MIRSFRTLAFAGLAASLAASPARAQSVEARIWLDRGNEAVLNRGDRVRVFYRTSADAFVAIFHLDTNGGVQLLYPSSPEVDPFVPGGRDYRLLFPRSSQWYVDEDPGIGYFFIVASPEPMDFRDFRYSYQGEGWDLSFVGRTVYDDPYVAMDEYIARLIPDWEYADYALDFMEYNVGERHDYPRFICYDCHGFTPYSTWNPYLSACTSFRVVVYNDPWYYPVNRYRGTRVVWVRPPLPGQPRYIFRERRPGEPSRPITMPRPSVGDRPGIPGDNVRRRSGTGIGSGGQPGVGGRTSPVPGRPWMSDPRSRPTGTAAPSTRTGGPSRPVLERRTGTGGSGGSVRPPARSRPTGGGSAQPPRTSTSDSGGVEEIRGRANPTGAVRPSGSPGVGTIRVAPRSGSVRPSARPGSGTSTRPGTSSPTTRPESSGSARPTPTNRGSTTGTVRPPVRSGGGGTVIRRAPTTRGGATARPSGSVRPSSGARSSGSSARPTSGSRSSGATVRTPPRSSGSGSVGTVRRPTVRPGGTGSVRPRSSGSVRPPPRSGSSGSVRPPPRSGGGSGSVRSGTSGSSGSRPARVRPRPRGGGGPLPV